MYDALKRSLRNRNDATLPWCIYTGVAKDIVVGNRGKLGTRRIVRINHDSVKQVCMVAMLVATVPC